MKPAPEFLFDECDTLLHGYCFPAFVEDVWGIKSSNHSYAMMKPSKLFGMEIPGHRLVYLSIRSRTIPTQPSTNSARSMVI